MEKINFKKYVPHLVAILGFVLISLIYFSPAIEGKKLKQGDIDRFKGMSKEITDHNKMYDDNTLWTNSMFGGMPAYFISVNFDGNLFKKVNKVLQLGLPHPANQVFVYFLGFFILLLVLRVKPWIAATGALAFAFSSYFFIIIEAGHNSKAAAVAWMAPVVAGIILTYRGKYIAGGLLTAFFLALEIAANHLQITYYLFLIILVYGIFELVETIRMKTWPHFLKASGVLVIAALLAVGTHATSLLISSDHTQYTTRGKSELTFNEENKTTGLDRDYVTQWSYGVAETWTLLVPDFMGGASYGSVGESSNTYEMLVNYRVPKSDAKAISSQLPLYWGTQPFTSGPVYVGALIFFLFIFGLIVVRGKLKWWLLTVTVLSILLAWGHNFMWFTDLFLDYFPGYNKFRAVTMILVIADFAIPLLAILALAKVFEKERDDQLLMKGLKYAFIAVGGILLIFLAIPGMLFDVSSPADIAYVSRMGYPENMHGEVIDALQADRLRILRLDAFRSLIFIFLGAALMWLLLKNKLKAGYVMAGIALLVIIDMWGVDKRYLNDDNFVRAREADFPYQPTEADKKILDDREGHFRVLNLTVEPFSDASTSYFHRSLGGYHGAKLKRYQELIEYQISPEMRSLVNVLSSNPNPENIGVGLKNSPILNMLNTKYLIVRTQAGPQPVLNPYALGTCWFVADYELVENPDEEIVAIADIDPANTLVVDKRFADFVSGKQFNAGENNSIRLDNYKANHLTYESDAATEQLAVFSEIYYPNGWNAFIDGEPAEHFRANWILRAMVIPAGKHTIEFKFEPKIYSTGEAISYASSILLLLLVLGYGVIQIRKNI